MKLYEFTKVELLVECRLKLVTFSCSVIKKAETYLEIQLSKALIHQRHSHLNCLALTRHHPFMEYELIIHRNK